ncbi:MAG: hypothetical protein D6705_14900 [Deltaproteobacteria bacterium]|nr:MAG: hypothetical protein D6705_14900 [Deltaproteobacteria bacterium]
MTDRRTDHDPILEALARRVAFADRFSYEATIAPFFRDLVRSRQLLRPTESSGAEPAKAA